METTIEYNHAFFQAHYNFPRTFSKNPLNNSRKLPCYLTTVIGQDSIETFIDDGLNIQKPLFVAGTCVDNGAIPNNQMIEFIKDIPITKSDAIKLATIIANTKRAFKNTITYTIEGTRKLLSTSLRVPCAEAKCLRRATRTVASEKRQTKTAD